MPVVVLRVGVTRTSSTDATFHVTTTNTQPTATRQTLHLFEHFKPITLTIPRFSGSEGLVIGASINQRRYRRRPCRVSRGDQRSGRCAHQPIVTLPSVVKVVGKLSQVRENVLLLLSGQQANLHGGGSRRVGGRVHHMFAAMRGRTKFGAPHLMRVWSRNMPGERSKVPPFPLTKATTTGTLCVGGMLKHPPAAFSSLDLRSPLMGLILAGVVAMGTLDDNPSPLEMSALVPGSGWRGGVRVFFPRCEALAVRL